MVYYVFDSRHEDNGGRTEGYMYLREEEGPEIPKNIFNNFGTGFIRKEYFPTYEEAKKLFQANLMDYFKYNNICMDTHDMVINDHYIHNA